MGAIVRRRMVWAPLLAAWLVLGVGLGTWLTVVTVQRLSGAAVDAAVHVTGTGAPADLPADFPIYPGAHVVESFRTGAGTEGVFIETPDSEARVFAFYSAALQRSPWHIEASFSFPVRSISFTHQIAPEYSCSLVVQRSPDGSSTWATFEWFRVTG